MEQKFILGSVTPLNDSDVQPLMLLKSIEKRLENLEKLLLEIQKQLTKADGIETTEKQN